MMNLMRSTTRLGHGFEWARHHHDLLTTSVLAAEGLTPRQIRDLADDGVIERIIRGLYRLAGTRTPLQDVAAVVMRHRGAVASHTSALFVHGFDVVPPAAPHFTLPPGSTNDTTLGVLHRSPLQRMDRTDLRVAREYDSIKHHGADRIEADEERRQRVEALGWSIEPLYRHHLLPAETAWLVQLRRELHHRRAAAS